MYLGSRLKKANLPATTVFSDQSNVWTDPQKVNDTAQVQLTLHRAGAESANLLSSLDFSLDNLAHAEKVYAQISGVIEDPTTSSEKGQLIFKILHTGALRNALKINNDGTIEWGTPTGPLGKFSDAGLSTQRTFTFPDASTQLVGLGAANVFTAAQKIQTTGVAPLTVYRTGITTGSGLYTAYNAPDNGGTEKNYGRLTMNILDNTAGSEDAEFVVSLMLNGVMSTALRIDNTGIVQLGTPGTLRMRLDSSNLTGIRTYTFPNSSVQLASASINNQFSAVQTISLDTEDVLELKRPVNTVGSAGRVGLKFIQNNASNAAFSAGLVLSEIVDNTAGVEFTNIEIWNKIAGTLRRVGQFDSSGKFFCGGQNFRVGFSESGLTAQRTFTFPNVDAQLDGVANTVILSNKTLDSSCNVSAAVGGGGGGGGGGSIMPVFNYVIRKSGANYIALDCFTGIESSNTNLTTLLDALETALASTGGHIHFAPGDFSLTTLWTCLTNNIMISGSGVDITRIVIDTATTPNATSIRIGTTSLGTAHTLSSNAAFGQRVIVADSTTGIAAGDWIFITSDKLVDATSTTRKYAEFHKVLSVDSGTQITVEDNLMVDFTTTDLAAYYKVPWVMNFQLKDITIFDNRGDNNVATAGDGPFHCVFCYGLHFDNVKLEQMSHDCCRIEGCWEPILDDVYCETPVSVADDPDHEYGIYVTGATTNFQWNGGWGNRCRHTITNNTNSGGIYRRGRQRNGTLNGVSSFNSNVANFDLHQAAIGWTFNGCIAIGGQHETVSVDVQGFNLRSPATLNGCVVQGATHESIVVWIDGDGPAPEDFRPGGSRTSIIGCQIISPLPDDVDTVCRGIVIQENRHSVVIDGCQFFDINQESILMLDAVSDVTITNNIFTSCGADLASNNGIIKGIGGQSNIIVTGNNFSAGTPSPAGRPLVFDTACDHVVFEDNVVTGLTNKLPTILTGSTDTRIENNPGLNPVNKIATAVNQTNNTIGLYGGTTATVEASTDTTIVGSAILITSTGGTGVSITLKDGAGNTIASGLTTLTAQYLPMGYIINFGAFSGAPTVTVFAI